MGLKLACNFLFLQWIKKISKNLVFINDLIMNIISNLNMRLLQVDKVENFLHLLIEIVTTCHVDDKKL